MYKATPRITVDNSKLKVFNKEYGEYMISIQQQILEGLAKEMYKNNCIAIEQIYWFYSIERIERNTSDPNNITYTVTGYAITQEKNQSIDMKKQKPTPAQKIFEEVLPEEVEKFINIIKPVKNIYKIISKDDERSND